MKFKMIKAALLGFALSVSGFTNATLIDFQTSSGVTQSGFNGVNANNATVGGITFTFDGVLYNRNTLSDAGLFNFSNLYNDFLYDNTAGPMTLTLSGLNANSLFNITFFSSDRFNGALQWATDMKNTFTPVIGSGGVVDITWNRLVDPTSNLVNSGTGTFMSSDNGTLSFEITGVVMDTDQSGSPFVRLNGLEINEVPEPSTLAILALALIGLGARRLKK